MRRYTWVLNTVMLLALLGFCIGCDNRQQGEEKEDLASLPYARATHHDKLKAELNRIEAEQATPRLLEASRRGAAGGTGKDLAGRLIRELNEICPASAVQRALREIERVYPTGEFSFDPVKLERFREIQRRHLSKLKQYRRLFRRDGFQFHVSLSDGLVADLGALDHAQLAHRLEAFCAADELGRGKPNAAMFALRTMLLIDARLSAVPSVSARRVAAVLRAEALKVVAALVNHPQCSATLREELSRIVEAHLDTWTPDRVTWIGDRALGLHAYELVRDGQLLSLLTPREIARMEKAGDLDAFCTAVQDSVDEDEWFYLSTMRRVIAACEQPFFKRVDVLERINKEADRLLATQDAPLFATTVLLPDMARIHCLMAIDRARCEAWGMALRAAAKKPMDRTAINPVTGKPYDLVREMDAIVVRNLEGTEDEEVAVSIPVPEG